MDSIGSKSAPSARASALIVVGWLVVLGLSLSAVLAFAGVGSASPRWASAAVITFVFAALTLLAGFALGLVGHVSRVRRAAACLLASTIATSVLGVAYVALMLNSPGPSDDAAAVGVVLLALPTWLAFVAALGVPMWLGILVRRQVDQRDVSVGETTVFQSDISN